MLLVRWLLLLIVILLVVWFAYQNFEDTVVVRFWQYQSKALPVFVVIFISFLAGNIVWFFKTAMQSFQLKRAHKSLQKENDTLKKELSNLRNISIEDTVEEGDEG